MTLRMITATDVLLHPTLQGVQLPAPELAKIPGYIADASALIEGYLKRTFPDPPDTDNPQTVNLVPDAARLVCRRMVARVLTSAPIDANFDAYASTMGPMSHTKHVAQDVLGGGVWLTNQDKVILNGITSAGVGVVNIPLYAISSCPPAPPNWWKMTPASGVV